jgi:hypothetical protein
VFVERFKEAFFFVGMRSVFGRAAEFVRLRSISVCFECATEWNLMQSAASCVASRAMNQLFCSVGSDGVPPQAE